MTSTIPSWPVVTATVREDGTGEVNVGGRVHELVAESIDLVRVAASTLIAQEAAKLGRPLSATTLDPSGSWPLIVHPDGRVEPNPQATLAPAAAPAAAADTAPVVESATAEVTGSYVDPANAPLPTRRSFIAEETKIKAATKGWRGVLSRVGVQVGPSPAELAERAEVQLVSQHWPGPRTIAITNGKGGAGKTPSTALLAALFARYGGSGVLAWDNNETRGTLGWRTEKGPHDATLQTLLPNTAQLLSPSAQASDLSRYVHHQTGDKYDVLRSNPNVLSEDQRLTTADFDAIHAVATKYFRLIFLDSGNDESAERWKRMIDKADQLVIASTAQGEHAEAGALLLEALRTRDEHSARLADGAVVIVSQSDSRAGITAADNIAAGFEPIARKAVSIPFDSAMHGGKLSYDTLAPATRRAWLAAAAAVAEGL
ncbi:hypothetical protein J7E29_16625 [Streptomyces sp. ISL-90]|nr:hypothetical protein [Streptomyces sp. ISL-90]